MIDVIDLVHPPVIWRDKRADRVFLPTEEIKNEYIDLGFSPDKLVVSGFPIREDIIVPSKPKKVDGKVNILMVNPSINLRKNKKFLLEVSSIEGERLYNMACALKEKYNLANVEVVGFIKDMNRRLSDAHILLTKAGPNMILEGARSGTAIVVTGHIPGQEANNYLYVTENDFGIKCENPKKIAASLRHMIEHDLDRYLANVLNSKCNDGAHIIAEAIDQYLKEVNGKK